MWKKGRYQMKVSKTAKPAAKSKAVSTKPPLPKRQGATSVLKKAGRGR
jgi:hypothetical protein